MDGPTGDSLLLLLLLLPLLPLLPLLLLLLLDLRVDRKNMGLLAWLQ